MRIAVDVMGGDKSPEAIIQGAVFAARQIDGEIILIGNEEILKKHDFSKLPISIHPATQVVGMNESPSQAFRKKQDSSIVVGIKLVKSAEADIFVSAGNSGAIMVNALIVLGSLSGIDRPALALTYPTLSFPSVIIDIGANVDCKPKHLLQFAIMGSVYARHILKREKPKVGLLNIGEEEKKGNELTIQTHKLLKDSDLNFIGNIEPRDAPTGICDVVVCDGFVGNVMIKLAEGIERLFSESFRGEINKSFIRKIGALLLGKTFHNVKKRLDSEEYGGVPLLGVNGGCIICHGSSSPKAISKAIMVAAEFVKKKVNQHIREKI